MEILLASDIFRAQGCKVRSLIEAIPSTPYPPLAWLLGARLCELWHKDWDAWILSHKPIDGPAYFEGPHTDAEVLETWVRRGADEVEAEAIQALRTNLATTVEIKAVRVRYAVGKGGVDA